LSLFIGCYWSRYYYDYNPESIELSGWKIDFYLIRVEYDEEKGDFVRIGTERERPDTLFELSILYSAIDSVIASQSELVFENVSIEVSKDSVIILPKEDEYTGYGPANGVYFGPFQHSGPLPDSIITYIEIVAYNKATHQVIGRRDIRAIARYAIYKKLWIRDFLDGR
jgi:hypothetical protein